MSGNGGGLWLLGCGNMGGALLRRWLAEGYEGVCVIDPAAKDLPGSVRLGMPETGSPDVLILAVKPQMWRTAIVPLLPRLAPTTIVVSVIAGAKLADLAAVVGDVALVRAMPNTPAGVGMGITGLYTHAGELVRGAADALFAPAGQTVWLDAEGDFDALTGLSGSGPAYVFAMIEALAAAGEAAGLAPALAERLARATVTGAAALAVADNAPPAELRRRVTSPAGTTAAGLEILLPALTPLMTETVAAAAARSRELG